MTGKKTDTIRYFERAFHDKQHEFTVTENSVLDYTNRKVAAGDTLKDIMEFFFRETGSVMPCDRIGVAFLEEDNRRLVLYHVIADYSPLYLTEGYTADVTGSSLMPVFGKGVPRIINDLVDYYKTHSYSESTALLLKEGVHSSMTCPLTVEGRIVGVMFRSSRKKNAYGDREIRLHQAMVERLSQAVEKAWRIEQLTRAFNSYMEMLGFVAHELKSPLSSIVTLGQTLLGGYHGNLDEKAKEMVHRMVQRAEHLIGLSGEYLNLSRIESGSLHLNPRETDFIVEIINPALEVVAPQIEANNVVLEKNIPVHLPPVYCDPELMKIVMINLLSNAVKYGEVRGSIKLSITAGDTVMAIHVWNSGPGFPESEKKNLFKKFSRLQTKELMGRKGSGIGLYMSWKTVVLHGGSIKADSREGEWAQFTVELPLEGPLKNIT